jgi:hypothetical protein
MKKKGRGKKYRRKMRMIQRYRNTYRDGYKKLSPSITFKHRIMEDGRVLTREELRDIFNICNNAILLEKKRLQEAENTFPRLRIMSRTCIRIKEYYSKYRNTEVDLMTMVILHEVMNDIFKTHELPFLRVSYDNIAGVKEKKNEEG